MELNEIACGGRGDREGGRGSSLGPQSLEGGESRENQQREVGLGLGEPELSP